MSEVQLKTIELNRQPFALHVWPTPAQTTPAVLHFAHANGFCARTYSTLLDLLAKRHLVLAMDLRGHGQSRAPAVPSELHSWECFADDLEQLILAQPTPLYLVGHSLGGITSLLAAARQRQRVRGLVLIDPTLFPHSWRWPLLAIQQLGLGDRISYATAARKRRQFWSERARILSSYRRKAVFRSWQAPFLSDYVQYGTRQLPDGRFTLSCHPLWESRIFATSPHDVWPLLESLTCPLLVLYGYRSNTFRHAAARRIRRLMPAAKLYFWPDAGHFLPMEHPMQVARQIEDFIRLTQAAASETFSSEQNPERRPRSAP